MDDDDTLNYLNTAFYTLSDDNIPCPYSFCHLNFGRFVLL